MLEAPKQPVALGLQVCRVSPVGPESSGVGGGVRRKGKRTEGGGRQAVPTSAVTSDML